MSCKIVRLYAGLLCSTTLASPVFVQAGAPQQTQQQIQELQQQNQQLQDRLNDVSNALNRQQQDISALKNAPQQVPAAPGLGDGWKVGIVSGRPTLYSADGQNSIALVGRFQFDVGEYFQSKAPGPTPPDFRTQKDGVDQIKASPAQVHRRPSSTSRAITGKRAIFSLERHAPIPAPQQVLCRCDIVSRKPVDDNHAAENSHAVNDFAPA